MAAADKTAATCPEMAARRAASGHGRKGHAGVDPSPGPFALGETHSRLDGLRPNRPGRPAIVPGMPNAQRLEESGGFQYNCIYHDPDRRRQTRLDGVFPFFPSRRVHAIRQASPIVRRVDRAPDR